MFMAQLTIELPETIARRLEALAQTSGKSVDELVLEALDSFAGSISSRRAIVKARRAAAKAAGTGYSLADVGWLEGYSGQTVDELLLFEGTEGVYTILSALEQAVKDKVSAAGTLKMTGVERMLLSAMALLREVNNGGYDQFFRNSSRRFAPAIVDDLVRVGCTEIADITQQALDSLNLPELTVAAIEAVMGTESTSRDRALQRCNIAFYSQTEVWGRLFLYVKAHQDGIRI
jgi:predicted transcriptional regulator